MFGTDFCVLINCELFVISSSYTNNPQLPFLWVNGKSMKCNGPIPRTAAIGAAVWNTTMMTHTERKKDANQGYTSMFYFMQLRTMPWSLRQLNQYSDGTQTRWPALHWPLNNDSG
jgi:hypothetical protein